MASSGEGSKLRRANIEARRDNLSRIDNFLDRLSSHTANVDNPSHEEKRVIIDKLGVTARVWPKSAPQRYIVEMVYDLDALAAQALEPEPTPLDGAENPYLDSVAILQRIPTLADKTATRSSHLPTSAIL